MLMGGVDSSLSISEEDSFKIAAHEAGHAIMELLRVSGAQFQHGLLLKGLSYLTFLGSCQRFFTVTALKMVDHEIHAIDS